MMDEKYYVSHAGPYGDVMERHKDLESATEAMKKFALANKGCVAQVLKVVVIHSSDKDD